MSAVLVPVFSTLFGAVLGFCGGALVGEYRVMPVLMQFVAVAVSTVYVSANFYMEWWMALAWGMAMPVLYIIQSILVNFMPILNA